MLPTDAGTPARQATRALKAGSLLSSPMPTAARSCLWHAARGLCPQAGQRARLVSSSDLIALEDLQIRNLVRNRRLAKAISDAGWARFRAWVEEYGRVQQVPVLAVPPHSTSQACSSCSRLVRTSLSVRTHVCPHCGHCGLILDRDHNAAVVIREAGLAQAIQQGIWDPVRHRRVGSGTVGHTGTETRRDSRARGSILSTTFVQPACRIAHMKRTHE